MTTEPQPTPTPAATPVPPPATGPQTPQAEPAPSEQAQANQARTQPAGQAPRPAAPLPHHRIKRTRTSGVWVAVGFFAILLLFLLIFILQNGQSVEISYLGAHGHIPLGVALLLSAVCGVLLVVLAGAARISQLRATARRHRRADAKRAAAAVKAGAGPVR
jgi:uncharacterized integral membrane protein